MFRGSREHHEKKREEDADPSEEPPPSYQEAMSRQDSLGWNRQGSVSSIHSYRQNSASSSHLAQRREAFASNRQDSSSSIVSLPYPGESLAAQNDGEVDEEIRIWFMAVDEDNSGHINYQELQAALINEQGKMFSDNACQLMISMFDDDHNGKIDIYEFQQLYKFVNRWMATFRMHDTDKSGYIDEEELTRALRQIGYKFSPQFSKLLLSNSFRFKNKQMSADEFIITCVRLERLTEAFKKHDRNRRGVATLDFESYLDVSLNFFPWK